MGLQKGQSGYVFRWLMPIFSLVGALILFINAGIVTLVIAGVGSFIMTADSFAEYLFDIVALGINLPAAVDDLMLMVNLYVASIWMGAVLLLVLAIIGFVMNKKSSYIFGAAAGGVTALAYLIKGIIYLAVYSKIKEAFELLFWYDFSEIKPIMLLGIYMLFIFAIGLCVCLFGALAIPKCDYEKSVGERHIAGENLTYVGFENDPSAVYGAYHQQGAPGPVDPYAAPVAPEPEKKAYVPQGPTGCIIGVKGMYRDARFTIADNEEIVIGRDPRSAQIVIGEGAQNVSRQHCRISYSAADNTYRINDMSKNGTYSSSNKSRLPHGVVTKVPAGTEIYLGDRSNTFRLE